MCIKVFFIALLCIGLLAIYSFYIEPNIVIIRNYKLNENTEPSYTIKIIHLADLHISENYTEEQLEHLVNKVNKLEPDIITFSGDLYDNFAVYGPTQKVIASLKRLNATYGKYAVWGNRDYGGGAGRQYESIMTSSDFKLLQNDSVKIQLENGKNLWIGGVDDYLLGKPDIDKTLSGLYDADYKIILMHEPDKADSFKTSIVDLILAGHSHGGQVRIPFFTGITTSLAKKYIRGFYTINPETNLKLFVNTGIGTTRIPARFLVPPEISVFHLTIINTM